MYVSYGDVEVGTAYEKLIIFDLLTTLTLTQTRNLVLEWLCTRADEMNLVYILHLYLVDPVLMRCDINAHH